MRFLWNRYNTFNVIILVCAGFKIILMILHRDNITVGDQYCNQIIKIISLKTAPRFSLQAELLHIPIYACVVGIKVARMPFPRVFGITRRYDMYVMQYPTRERFPRGRNKRDIRYRKGDRVLRQKPRSLNAAALGESIINNARSSDLLSQPALSSTPYIPSRFRRHVFPSFSRLSPCVSVHGYHRSRAASHPAVFRVAGEGEQARSRALFDLSRQGFAKYE